MMLSTDLWSRIQEGHCITSIGQCVDGVTVPSLIVGDSAFSLCTWLMKPYTNAVPTPQQRNFNWRLRNFFLHPQAGNFLQLLAPQSYQMQDLLCG